MVLPSPIASLVLEDIRRAATFLEDISTPAPISCAEARQHAVRLWAASQAVERLVMAVEQLVVVERSRRIWDAES